jgi:SAM-dependent methyltransferase
MAGTAVRWRDYVELYRAAVNRLGSEEAYRTFQALQAQLLVRYMEAQGVRLQDRLLVDLGSGLGGYSLLFQQQGARVVSLDLMADKIRLQGPYQAVSASAQAVPLATGSIDIVFCASLIEHVPDPAAALREIRRILVPGGICYLSFPPFYSWRGGHEYAPYHYLGEKAALRIVGRGAEKYHPDWIQEIYQVSDTPDSFAGIYADWGLYVMTVAKARRLIAQTPFTLLDMSTRYMPASFIRWPLLGEVLTWHAQFLLRKD